MLTKDDVARMPRAERLERLARTGPELDAAIADCPEAMLCRRPDEKNWAPKEVVCHLRDTEEFFMLRFQTLAATRGISSKSTGRGFRLPSIRERFKRVSTRSRAR